MKKPISRRVALGALAVPVAVPVALAGAWAVARSREATRVAQVQAQARRALVELVERDVPAPRDFDRLLRRDVSLFYRQSSGRAADASVEVLNRNREPIPSGSGRLRFYVWARFSRGKKLADEGVALADAVGRTRFAVTGYLPRASLREGSRGLGSMPDEVRAVVSARLK